MRRLEGNVYSLLFWKDMSADPADLGHRLICASGYFETFVSEFHNETLIDDMRLNLRVKQAKS
jgi:hypothetical protein